MAKRKDPIGNFNIPIEQIQMTVLSSFGIANPRFFTDTFMGGTDINIKAEEYAYDYPLRRYFMAHGVTETSGAVSPYQLTDYLTQKGTLSCIQAEYTVDYEDIRKRIENERFLGDDTYEGRMQYLIGRGLMAIPEGILNTAEKMVADMVTMQPVNIVGINGEVLCTYEFPFEFKKDLTGSDMFSDPTADVLGQVREQIAELGERTSGVDMILMAEDVGRVLLENQQIQQLGQKWNGYGYGQIDPKLIPEKQDTVGKKQFWGFLPGIEVPLYTQRSKWYEATPDGGMGRGHLHLPEGTMIFSTPESRRNQFIFGEFLYKDSSFQRRTGSGLITVWDKPSADDQVKSTYVGRRKSAVKPYRMDVWASWQVMGK